MKLARLLNKHDMCPSKGDYCQLGAYVSSTSSSKAENMGASSGLPMGNTVGPAPLSCLEKAICGMGLADMRWGAMALRITFRSIPAVSS